MIVRKIKATAPRARTLVAQISTSQLTRLSHFLLAERDRLPINDNLRQFSRLARLRNRRTLIVEAACDF